MRDALRSLRKSPAFVAVATISLGLALGVTTTTYAVLDALTNPTVPFDRSDQLFSVFPDGDGAARTVTSYEKYVALRDGTTFYADMTLMSTGFATVRSPTNVVYAPVFRVGVGFFSLLGVAPERGRLLGPDDSQAAIISFGAWRQWFGGRSIDGQTLTIDERVFDIVGVLPPGAEDPFGTNVWIRMSADAELGGRGHVIPIVRLKADVEWTTVQAELRRLERDLTAIHGTGQREFFYKLRPLEPDPLELRPFHMAMAGAAAFVLLIACANLANLMLARGMRYRPEFALRLALGATRLTIVRHVLIESAAIGLGGAMLGIVLAVWANDILIYTMPPSIEMVGLLTPSLSWRVFAFALGATGVTVLLFGALPALRTSNVSLSEPLKDRTGTTTQQEGRRYNLLVITEIALSLVLLMGAGLLLRAVERVGGFDFGYDPTGLVRVFVPVDTAIAADSVEVFSRGLLQRALGIDGVSAAATMRSESPDGLMIISDVWTGQGEAQVNTQSYTVVSDGFFRTIGLPVVAGRDFLPGEAEAGGAVIVNQTAAQLLWPDGEPVGRRLKLGRLRSDREWLPVVGVVRNAAFSFERDPDMLFLPPSPRVYVVGSHTTTTRMWLVAKLDETRPHLGVELARAIRLAQPGPWVPRLYPWLWSYEEELSARRFIAGLFGVFGTFALALAAIGLYGVLAYSVSRRMREFGVRLALGARGAQVLKLVLHDGFVMLLGGTAIGAIVAMWSANLLGRWLYNVNPTDVTALVGAEVVLCIVSIAGCVAPALRAARANPLDILRAT